MPSLTSFISFDAKFILSENPVLQLTAKTTIPVNLQPNLIGYFSVIQPDGIETVASFGNPDVTWADGGKQTINVVLRKGQDGLYVQGGYIIEFFARHPDYTDGFFARDFGMQYEAVKLGIQSIYDFYTPEIKFADNTNYAVDGWAIKEQNSAWVSYMDGMNYVQSITPNLDAIFEGGYYASKYDTRYTKDVLYENATDPWLSILQLFSWSEIMQAYAPLPMTALVTYLEQLKKKTTASCGNSAMQALYEKAANLYTLIRGKVCLRQTINLKEYFEEFYKLTHDGAPLAYPKNGARIPAYDFATGCGGSTDQYYQLRPTPGVSSFTIPLPAGSRIKAAVRSGLAKGITTGPTTDTEQLQIVNNQVTLPTGDIVGSTIVNSAVVGELFIFTYS
jgi:hypothetical protein